MSTLFLCPWCENCGESLLLIFYMFIKRSLVVHSYSLVEVTSLISVTLDLDLDLLTSDIRGLCPNCVKNELAVMIPFHWLVAIFTYTSPNVWSQNYLLRHFEFCDHGHIVYTVFKTKKQT